VRDSLSSLDHTVAEPLMESLAPAFPGFHAPAPQLNLLQRLLYSGGLVGGYIADTAIVTWALYYYAPPAGHGQALAPITWVAAALVFGRIIDAVLNPLVG
jgi:Na+/melibiose symporter-like transporter